MTMHFAYILTYFCQRSWTPIFVQLAAAAQVYSINEYFFSFFFFFRNSLNFIFYVAFEIDYYFVVDRNVE